jgi:hypothetical protein
VALLAVLMVLPIGGYLVWYHQHHGVYATNQVQGRFLWSRTTSFVDCERHDFTPAEQDICPKTWVVRRPPPDEYVWGYDEEHLTQRFHPEITDDEVFASFARKAILGQPLDFVKTVVKDTFHMAQPWRVMPNRTQCMTARWDLPHPSQGGCRADLLADGYRVEIAGTGGDNGSPVAYLLHNYGNIYTVPPALYLHIGLIGLLLALWRARRDRRRSLESLLLGTTGLALLVGAIATSAIDPRYGLPMLVLAPVATVLALKRARTPEQTTEQTAETAETV